MTGKGKDLAVRFNCQRCDAEKWQTARQAREEGQLPRVSAESIVKGHWQFIRDVEVPSGWMSWPAIMCPTCARKYRGFMSGKC